MPNSETIEPAYVLDTNTLIWHLTKSKRLSQRAKRVFEAAQRGETRLIVSAIVLTEMFYADKKWKLFDNFEEIYAGLKKQPHFRFLALEPDHVLDFTEDAAVPEMPDRIIAGLARRLGVPLLTNDPLITTAGGARTEW